MEAPDDDDDVLVELEVELLLAVVGFNEGLAKGSAELERPFRSLRF